MITLSGREGRFGSGHPAVVTAAVPGGPCPSGTRHIPRGGAQTGTGPAPLEGRKMKQLLPLAAAATALAAPLVPAGPARAQTYDLGEIVVSPNLEPTDVNKVGATVDVVSAKDLQGASQSSVAQALAFEPGITITPNGGVGSKTYLSIRGAPAADTAVLIDGIDVTDPSAPQVIFDFGHLTTAGIGSVEILKGSQSAVYGSSAVAGVVDITSRHATEEGVHAYTDAEVGTYGTANLSFTGTVKTKDSDLAVTLSHTGTKGFPAWTGQYANGKDDGYYANRLSMNGSHSFGNGVKIGFAGFLEANHGDYFPGGLQFASNPTALAPLAFATQKSDTGGLRVYAQFDTGAVTNTISATTYRVSRDYVEGPAAIASDNAYVGTRQKLSYQGAVSLGAKARLVFGADTMRETFSEVYTSAYGTSPESADRRISGVFAELSYSPTETVDLTGSVRRDHQSSFGDATTGRLSLVWRAAPDLTVRASAGTGFRAPSPYELYDTYAGNPNLQPEKSRSLDLGVEKRFGDAGYVKATAFWLSADNLIDYSYTTFSYTQIAGTSRRSGIELEGQTKLGAGVLTGTYTYTDSAVNVSSNWASVPRHAVGLKLAAPLAKKLTGEVTSLSGFDRPNGLENFTVIGAGLSYAVTDRVEAYLRVENLFDAKYQLVQNYATPGRSVYVGIRASF